jgi:DNA-binding NtrC family response regulator
MTAVDKLEEAGFQVLEAANTDAALTVLEACSEEVHVLFTGVNLLGSMDSMALAEQVHQRWSHIRLLIASGCIGPHPDEIPDCGRFMPVPFSCGTSPR